jgi:hypothetical protein
MFKSAEEREAARREREAEQDAWAEQAREAEEELRREEFLATPYGAAKAAMEAGEAFFEIQLKVGSRVGSAGFGSIDGRHSVSSSASTLGVIEQLGWRLEHAGYFFMITGESSTQRVFATGDNTAVSGVTVGVYLFRNATLR